MSDFVDVLALSTLPEGSMRSLEVNGHPVLLANDGGEIRAIGAICTHEQEDLADGDLEDHCVVCAMHFARFSLITGEVLEGPAEEPEPVYDVRVDGDRILVAAVPTGRP